MPAHAVLPKYRVIGVSSKALGVLPVVLPLVRSGFASLASAAQEISVRHLLKISVAVIYLGARPTEPHPIQRFARRIEIQDFDKFGKRRLRIRYPFGRASAKGMISRRTARAFAAHGIRIDCRSRFDEFVKAERFLDVVGELVLSCHYDVPNRR